MNKETLHHIKLGVFVITGMIILILGLYFIGSNKNMLGRTISLYTTFRNVSGLQNGNNVRYAGIDVGTIENIIILNDTTIRVEMSIKPDLKKVIRKNSMTSLGSDGLVGNKLVNIDPGTPDAPFVIDGDELSSIRMPDTESMLRTLESTNNDVSAITSNLKTITNNINKSKGTFYTILMDTTLAVSLHHSLSNIESSTSNLNQITEDLSGILSAVRDGKGLAGTLLKDTVISKDLQQSVALVKKSSEQINASAEELNQALQKLNSENGTIGKLLNDTAMANQLKRSMENIEKSTRSFNENMEAMKQSVFLRGYFKRQERINNQ